MKIDKRIVILLIIIGILAIGVTFAVYSNHGNVKETNNTTIIKHPVKNATFAKSANAESGKYGYCAICGKALTASEANDEYTQGKVCHDCAANPYYETPEGAEYANQKLYEAYPDEYSWMNEDSGEDYDDYDDYEYEDEDY